MVESNVEEIKQVLRYAMIKVGLRAQNFPTDEEKEILIAHVVQNFGYHTTEEVKLAFDMAISGKLELDEVKCYENFSCLYLSQIMVGYRVWATQTNAQIKREDESHRALIEGKPIELTEIDYLELYIATKADVLAGVIDHNLVPDMLYDWMERKGTIKLTQKRKVEFFNLAATKKLERYRDWLAENPTNNIAHYTYNSYRVDYEQKMFKLATRNEIKSLAKKLVVFEYIKGIDGRD